jgi:tRNA threonylcarbamoyladenosine biosynthesis protein TsaB
MRILGIDTATSSASAALVDDENLIGEEIWDNRALCKNGAARSAKGTHAEIILPLIQSVLSTARIDTADLSGIGVSIGPGSFTGLRIGLATIKGIAYDWGLPVVGISTLQANAARVTSFNGLVCSMLDARKGEVYWSLFRSSGEKFTRLTTESVTSISSAIDRVQNYYCAADGASLVIVGDGAKAYKKLLFNSFGTNVLLSTGNDYPTVAAQVARFARQRIMTHTLDDVGALVPVYLRRPEAESKKIINLTC